MNTKQPVLTPSEKQVETREDDSDIMGQDDDRKAPLGISIATGRGLNLFSRVHNLDSQKLITSSGTIDHSID